MFEKWLCKNFFFVPKVSKYMCADIQTSKIDFCLFTSPLKIAKFLNREWGGVPLIEAKKIVI